MQPEGKPEAAKVAAVDSQKPAEAPKGTEAVHSQPPETDISAQIAAANNPREMQQLLDKMRQQKAAAQPAEAKPEEKPAEVAAEEKPAAAETTTEETKPAEETPAETKPEEADPDADVEGADMDVDAVMAPAAKRLHVRGLAEDDKVGRLAMGLLRRNKDLTLEAAMQEAKKKLGVEDAPKQEAAKVKGETPANDGAPKTAEEADAKIKELRTKRRSLNSELKIDEAAEVTEQIEDLLDLKGRLERQGERAATEQERKTVEAYNTQFDTSEKRAKDLYDFASDPNSDGGKRMKEIDDALKAADDPLFHSANKPLVIAQMVGRELRVAPKTPGAKKTTAVKPVVTTQPATPANKPKSVIPGGEGTTTPQTKDSASKFVESVGKVTTLADLSKLQKSLGLPHY